MREEREKLVKFFFTGALKVLCVEYGSDCDAMALTTLTNSCEATRG